MHAPSLLTFSSQSVTFSDAVNRQTVASEIVAAIWGWIGLVAAVPLTTNGRNGAGHPPPGRSTPRRRCGHIH